MKPTPGYDFCDFLPAFLDPVEPAADLDMYNLGIGDIRGVPGYVDVLREALTAFAGDAANCLVRLPGQQGFGPLCAMLAEIHSAVASVEFQKEDIVLTEGGCSGISIALAAVQEPGAKVAYAVPAFPYWCTLDSLSLKSIPIPFVDPLEYASTFGVRLREMVRADPSIRAVILNEPQNPMGVPLNEDQLRILGEVAEEHDLQVIVDDVAVTFAFRTGGWPARFIPEKHRYVVGSFTKQFAVPGMRLGWLIPPRAHASGPRSIVANLRAGVSNAVAVLGYHLLKTLRARQLEDAVAREVSRRLVATQRLLEDVPPGVHFWVPFQGLYVLGKIANLGKIVSSRELATALTQSKVKIIDYRFLFPPDAELSRMEPYCRLSVGGEPRTAEGFSRLCTELTRISKRA